ncbi:hypothetical protein [Deinococcus alpinitundrae]|uniref:hypothetical protein n=1 Tax=Deinococcus alpinitundrae TaxID=468913 RepID=UPI00137B723A|nr:hypothetical protein [Deinococcus alpinitundrae]
MTAPLNFVLNPTLLRLNYEEYPQIIDLGKLAFTWDNQNIYLSPHWGEWRSILDYLALIEHSREQISELNFEPVGSDVSLGMRYNSLALVFLVQAFLDIMAQWTKDKHGLKLKGSEIAFKKSSF